MESVMIDGIRCCKGHPIPFGATLTAEGQINFSINSADATGCTLELYHNGQEKPYAQILIPNEYRIGGNYAIMVFDQNMDDLEYTWRFDGSMKPEEGLRFNPDISLLDPYAKLISGREVWGADPEHKRPLRGKVIMQDFAWEGDRQLEIPLCDLIIYEMHVRGFTANPDSNIRHKGTYSGVVEMIPYLKDLGVNCVELLPVFEFDEIADDRFYEEKRLYNYWGYATVCFFAPKSGYAASGAYHLAADEMKNMVKKLHQNGIEVILDVVFNHTAEEDENGPTYNYRGIDNRTYYLLDEHGRYKDFSGCRNTVNCNNAIVREHILDCLRYWVSEYHIDGFRFDEAPILSRDTNGNPMKNPPLLETLAHDPILCRTKLIAEAWDAAGLYQVGSFPAPDKWAEWNGHFRDTVRHFVKSDGWAGPDLIMRLQGSPDMYPTRQIPSTVNFVTCHDGFTLNDLVSYNAKHNEANSEDNRDGVNDNASWNCGIEGPTDEPEIEHLRNRQVKNAFTLLMLSRGTPMMLSGDEFRNSQIGNNNTYCQDSPVSWLNWCDKDTHADVYAFFREMIHLRREHPVLRRPGYFTDRNSSGYPELSFHGEKAWQFNRWEPFWVFGFMYAEPAADFDVSEDCFIYCGVNVHWEAHSLELPILPDGMTWRLFVRSSDERHDLHPQVTGVIHLMPRSSAVLIGKRYTDDSARG
ncbi:MAG: glycogen debranching enzyme [Clostridia bacterium]|nr:glycogen debranching enzyme [Clostridia bacterium]